ncbi:S8 family serine peptidase [Jatrophihabitans sp.]|uniref:S8 family serine peptidase n=1 Tax=Jatrophihabitans sp. TaxID=1932789 RepID=UPI0030C7205E|nr:serine protease [Jatrophihabitans sp.]
MTLIPAWGDTFIPQRLPTAPGLGLAEPLSREWAYGDGSGRGVRVAIVDSGVDAAHPAVRGVAGGAVIEIDESSPRGVRVVDGPHQDVFGHGTACAGIIRSLAPGAELYSVRVLGAKLTGRAYVFAAGLQWCIENDMQVVNLSLSTVNNDWYAGFHDLCDAAANAGIVVVAAMSNVRKASYPSEFSSVLSVAAMATQDRETFACNPRPPAEWGAAGIDVDVPWLDGSTIRSTGNSYASPVIAGHAARILGAHPHFTTWQVRTALAALAVNAG